MHGKFILLLVAIVFQSCGVFSKNIPAANLVWWPNILGPSGSMFPIFLDAPLAESRADPDNIHFYLFTPNNPEEKQELIIDSLESIQNSSWIKGAPVKTLAHGFSSGINTGYPWNVRGAYLEWGQDMNLILVDWNKLAQPPFYNIAAENTKLVGEKSARLLAFLLANDFMDISDLHVQGISLGGHVAGVTGSTLTNLTGLKVPRISAYDPAGPLFANADDAVRIDPTDADFVDVIHTNGGLLGMIAPRGHVDFYPNGGKLQPGCVADVTGACSHFRASALNIESIAAGGTPFKSCLCASWEEYDNDTCDCAVTANLGEHVSKTAKEGSYFLRTNKEAPFAIAE